MTTFSESQITDLAAILGTNSISMSTHIGLYANVITDSDKTKVLAYITDWQAAENDFVSFTPTESNEGFNLDTTRKRNAFASKIASLLQWEDYGSGGLVRG